MNIVPYMRLEESLYHLDFHNHFTNAFGIVTVSLSFYNRCLENQSYSKLYDTCGTVRENVAFSMSN